MKSLERITKYQKRGFELVTANLVFESQDVNSNQVDIHSFQVKDHTNEDADA
jgi:hypothetical protein